MVESTRVQALNKEQENEQGQYVLYWMQASQRESHNHALEYAIERANERNLPLVVCFGLMDNFPEANVRHYQFLLEGFVELAAALEKRGIKFVVRHGPAPDAALHYAKNARLVVCDRGYTRHQKSWREIVAREAKRPVIQVESDVVIPVEVVSDHHEFAARTIRPKIHRNWNEYLIPLKPTKLKHSSLSLKITGNLDPTDPVGSMKKLKLDASVEPTTYYHGGQVAARKALKTFVSAKLKGYDEGRNEPAAGWTSHMSMFLHYGHISPIEIALAVREAGSSAGIPKADVDAYIEELIVRRELSMNFVHFNPQYDSYQCLPDWARRTLAEHAADKRPVIYTTEQLEQAKTHDPYWNAAQLEMTKTGFMHNYMRMYWGKKFLEWMRTPEEAYETAMRLNNKYFLDGRDPNGWANVAWIFGLHDRPWTEREIFGKIRYMNAAGLERKFDIGAYVKKVALL